VSFEVRFSAAAAVDLDRLYEFLLDRAQKVEDLDVADRVIGEVRATAAGQLSRSPYSFRNAGSSALTRELIIPARKTGYVALFAIQPPSLVLILAVRHQLEDD
jgi:plasmid stabilization system protein ParE